MKKKVMHYILIIPTLLILAACSSIQLPGAQTSATAQNPAQNQAMNFANQPVESKLAIGLLKLEGSSNAVTAEQAKTMLPLWQAVKSLGKGSTTTSDEMTALYQQIQDALTPGQLQTIKDMNLTQDEIQTLMQQNGIQMPQPGAMGTPGAGLPSAAQTQIAQQRASGGGADFPGGGPGGAGGPPPDGGFPGGPGGGTGGSSSSGGTTQGTPQPGQTGRGGGMRGGMNFLFVDPLIKLMETRSAS
jgi:hypothetical protein